MLDLRVRPPAARLVADRCMGHCCSLPRLPVAPTSHGSGPQSRPPCARTVRGDMTPLLPAVKEEAGLLQYDADSLALYCSRSLPSLLLPLS